MRVSKTGVALLSAAIALAAIVAGCGDGEGYDPADVVLRGFAGAAAAAYTETIPNTKVTFDMVPIPTGTFTMGSESEAGRRRH